MRARGPRSWLLRTALVGAILILLLWILNLPFYSGAGGPHWRWRMEHGRLRIEHRAEAIQHETFYVALNTEGLKFDPEWDFRGNDWMTDLPLWIPLALCVGLALASRSAPKSRPL